MILWQGLRGNKARATKRRAKAISGKAVVYRPETIVLE
jgi:hypothetical protein